MYKICWISNIPSPYKVNLMKLMGEELEIEALFEKRKENDREDSWYSNDFGNVKTTYLDGNYKETIKQKAADCDILLNGDYSNKICIYAAKVFKKHKKPVLLVADGGLAINRGILDYVIAYFMKKSDYFLSSGQEVNKYFKYYKVEDNKIYNYRFSSLTDEDIVFNKELLNQKDVLRKKHNIKEDIVLFSVGQQIPRKGYDILAQAMINMNKNVGLYIAGGDVEEKVKTIIEKNKLTNIHFIGFKSKEELKEFYALADIFVLPTRYDIWGLVINEAMSFGLPIISSNKCIAALEFNRLFKNALIFENENVDALSSCINKMIENKAVIKELGINSLKGIKEYTIENTSKDFIKIIDVVIRRYHEEN